MSLIRTGDKGKEGKEGARQSFFPFLCFFVPFCVSLWLTSSLCFFAAIFTAGDKTGSFGVGTPFVRRSDPLRSGGAPVRSG